MSLDTVADIQFIMDDFSFEQQFCNHFKFLRENKKVILSFNIDRCFSILNDKITILVYYDDASLDVENEKSRLDKSAAKCKLNEWGWRIPYEIATYRSIFQPGSVLFDRDFAYVTIFEFRRPVNVDEVFFDWMNLTQDTENNGSSSSGSICNSNLNNKKLQL